MSYNNKKATQGTYLIYLEASSATVSMFDSIAYTISTGTSGHGVTVSNGVISLPAGEWICYASVETDSLSTDLKARWYVNNVAQTDFTDIFHKKLNTQADYFTDMYTSAITLKGNVNVDLRVTDSNISNPTVGKSDLVIYGVRI